MDKSNIEKLIRSDLKQLMPYMPDRNKDAAVGALWMDSNENPYSEEFGRYPNPTYLTLRKKISQVKNISVENIFLSNGSDEVIDLIIRSFCEPKVDDITVVVPGFETYSHCAKLNANRVRTIRQASPFDFDSNMIESILHLQSKILFLCSPNNPTGKSISSATLKTILNKWEGIVVLDEAYVDFAPYESRITLIKEYAKLIVLQTFSKAWGLAAIRVGMTFANEHIIKALEAVKLPYNISEHSATMAEQALAKAALQPALINRWLDEKERMISNLQKCTEVVHIFPSDANFMLVKMKNGPALYQYLRENGVYVRLRKEPECANCLRISVGTILENDKLVQQIHAFSKTN